MQPNPLSKYYRQPSIYIKLPSGGKYWPSDAIEMPLSGEIPVLPMTARDEITLKTPDALLNGQAVVSVIESCIPNIKNAWAAPTMDIDTLLIAIRIASYGSGMDIDTNCPKCEHDNRHELDLSYNMQNVRVPDYNRTVVVDGLTIRLQPQNYAQANNNALMVYEEQKIMQVIQTQDIPDTDKLVQFNTHLTKLVGQNIEMMANSTAAITTPDGETVTDNAMILEFYTNAAGNIVQAVRSRIETIGSESGLPPTRVSCESCSAEYPVEVEFNYSNFFAPGS